MPHIGSEKFYKHAQNLLGGVKKEVGSIEFREQEGYYYGKKYYISDKII